MCLGLSLSRKKVQWKCCIKPLIRVEHIRIILRVQSGSCYAAACVVLLAPEFSPLICVHALRMPCVRCGIWCGVYLWEWDSILGDAWGVCTQADAKRVDLAVTRSHGWKPDGTPSPSSFTSLLFSLRCIVPARGFFLTAQLTSLIDSQLRLQPVKNAAKTLCTSLVHTFAHTLLTLAFFFLANAVVHDWVAEYWSWAFGQQAKSWRIPIGHCNF